MSAKVFKHKLELVAEPPKEELPSYAYEYEQRRKSASINWAQVHVAADRRTPFAFLARLSRTWRG